MPQISQNSLTDTAWRRGVIGLERFLFMWSPKTGLKTRAMLTHSQMARSNDDGLFGRLQPRPVGRVRLCPPGNISMEKHIDQGFWIFIFSADQQANSKTEVISVLRRKPFPPNAWWLPS